MIPESLLDDFEELNQNFVYAPFGKRMAAAILDMFIIIIFIIAESFFLGVLKGIFIFINFSTLVSKIDSNNIFMFILFLIPTVYVSYCECTSQQASPGKQIMGLQVVNMKIQRLTFRHAFIRAILRWISIVFYLIGYIPAIFTQKHQTFHDLVAKTLVVEKRSFNQNFQ